MKFVEVIVTGYGNVDTEFVNIPKRTHGTMSWQETREDGNEN
jgi:hypothetical protein